MSILLFSNNGQECENRLVEVVRSLTRSHALEVFHSVEELAIRFREPRGSLAVMIFIAGSRKDLIDLHDINNMFFDLPMILILPDRMKETARLGFKLYPRFVSYGDGKFEDVKGVLGNLLRRFEERDILKREKIQKVSPRKTRARKNKGVFRDMETVLGICI
jgi:hypothetical protein